MVRKTASLYVTSCFPVSLLVTGRRGKVLEWGVNKKYPFPDSISSLQYIKGCWLLTLHWDLKTFNLSSWKLFFYTQSKGGVIKWTNVLHLITYLTKALQKSSSPKWTKSKWQIQHRIYGFQHIQVTPKSKWGYLSNVHCSFKHLHLRCQDHCFPNPEPKALQSCQFVEGHLVFLLSLHRYPLHPGGLQC